MSKKIFYDDDARARVLGGAKALYDAVKVTFGPKGRNVVIEKGYGAPTITHDGVTVAEAVDLPKEDDETLGYEVGAKLIKTAAQKLNKNKDVIAYYEKYLELSPNAKDFAGVAYTIAVLSQQEGDKAKAKEYYEKITADPQYGAAAQEYLKNN